MLVKLIRDTYGILNNLIICKVYYELAEYFKNINDIQ